MNYIYNIYLNFNKIYYDFYEWNDTDKIIHIEKIPIIRISTEKFKEIVSSNILLSLKDFESIKNKTESKYYSNCLIITDTRNVYAINFNSKGNSISMSSFYLDDEYNILQLSKKIKEKEIKYKVISKKDILLDTREEIYKKKYIYNKIKKLPIDTIKYIYYDCFNKNENNYNKMISNIINSMNINTTICNKIFNILNPISTN